MGDGAGCGVEAAGEKWRPRRGLVTGGLGVLVAIPLLIALAALKQPRWYPLWDQATTEMQLRDVGTRHTPLTGVGGLLGLPDDLQGSHPGPLSFYLMWPVYRLLGSSSWAMQAAAAWVNVAAVAVILWLVSRRRSLRLLVGTVAALAILMHAYGVEALTKAWAPHTPILWWMVFLVACWCALCDDLPILPVAVFAGSFCVQTHSSYVLPALGLLLLAFGSASLVAYQQRHDRGLVCRTAKWSLLAVGVGAAVWIPPVLQQLISPRGNLAILWRQFRDWNEEPMGLWHAFELVLIHLNPWRLVTGEISPDNWIVTGSRLPGALVLLVWAGAAVIAVRLANRTLVRLHVLVAAALFLAVVAVSRLGLALYYRMLWLSGITVLLLMATVWTLILLVRRYLNVKHRQGIANRLVWGPLVAAVAFTTALAASAAGSDYDRHDSRVLDELVPRVVSTLERDYPHLDEYLLVWSELTTGALGRGLMNELVRRGFDVGAVEYFRAEVRPHRAVSPGEVSAVIVVVGGSEIATWRDKRAREIARVDRAGSQQAEASDKEAAIAVFVAAPAVLEDG
ncbi:MAG: hypothetical protein ACRDY6_06250 [Acidimicrobiia bacterium]